MIRVFFFNDTATTEIYTLSLHDALPISLKLLLFENNQYFPQESPYSSLLSNLVIDIFIFLAHYPRIPRQWAKDFYKSSSKYRSEEHTSELQSRQYLVCRLLLEKKK